MVLYHCHLSSRQWLPQRRRWPHPQNHLSQASYVHISMRSILPRLIKIRPFVVFMHVVMNLQYPAVRTLLKTQLVQAINSFDCSTMMELVLQLAMTHVASVLLSHINHSDHFQLVNAIICIRDVTRIGHAQVKFWSQG